MIPKRDAYVRIRDMIFRNEISPGTHLVERRLAEQLDMSRVPIREALQRLVLEGLLVYVPGKGLVTRTYDEHELLDLYHYREPLEGMAARLFCQRADDAEVRLVEELFAGMRRQVGARRFEVFHRYDFEFHLSIVRGSRNNRLIAELTDVYQECHYVTRTRFTPRTYEMSKTQLAELRSGVLAEHLAICEAVSRRDGDAAEEAARASAREGLRRFMQLFAGERLEAIDG